MPTKPGKAKFSFPKAAPKTDFEGGDFGFFDGISADNLLVPRSACGAPATIQLLSGVEVEINDVAITDYSPEWWFIYLWKEASSRITSATPMQRTTLLKFFNAVFIKPPLFGAANKFVIPRGPFLSQQPNGASPLGSRIRSALELRGYFTEMLRVGFDYTSLGANNSPEASSDAMLAFIQNSGVTIHYKLVWRGESSRTLQELRTKGIQTQAKDAGRSVTIRCNEEWHPFFVDDIKQKLWYRAGQNDNCLYSAISVATDWKASACFPKIEQTTDLSRIQQRVKNKESLQKLQPEFKDRIGWIVYQNGNAEHRLVTLSKVALLALDGMYVDTKARQEDEKLGKGKDTGYPEWGARGIAGSNVLGMVEYVRVHHGVEDDDGFTAFTRKSKSTMVSREDLLLTFVDNKAKTLYYATVEDAFTKASLYKPIGLRWKPTGFEEIKALTGVKEIWLDGVRIWNWS